MQPHPGSTGPHLERRGEETGPGKQVQGSSSPAKCPNSMSPTGPENPQFKKELKGKQRLPPYFTPIGQHSQRFQRDF